eukprot:TRINITY_DN10560_c0_g1_i2.p1 TRINITY_DN10560_c0_g1~~TRINITY_DN10560_c0_g1_i2.p1  ORF type:complete len:102 (-),score=29.13 TRINITY_DN10560_c0_g1_i2:136-441(-)
MQSKAANRLMSWHYADKFKSKGITVNALTPGYCSTKLVNFGGSLAPSEGAKVGIWLASSRDVEGITGKFYEHNLSELKCDYRDPKAIATLMRKFEEMDQRK